MSLLTNNPAWLNAEARILKGSLVWESAVGVRKVEAGEEGREAELLYTSDTACGHIQNVFSTTA